jgi:hypothetical protein
MMGICETVADLAVNVSASRSIEEPAHLLALELLRLMPLYREISDLRAWEAAVQDVLPDEPADSEVNRLLCQVFEFGRYNMYAEIDAAGTAKKFATLRESLQQSGIRVPVPRGLDSW